jgi:cytochrome c553
MTTAMHLFFARFFSFAILVFAINGFAQAPDLHDRFAACAACHGEHGEGKRGAQYYSHLAGKPAGYLFDQRQGFHDGRHVYPQMVSLVQNLDDAYMRDIADYYATQPPRLRAADNAAISLSAAMQARAKQLVRHGDVAAGVPACSACQGTDLTGLELGIPVLVGLPADYIVAQLGGW